MAWRARSTISASLIRGWPDSGAEDRSPLQSATAAAMGNTFSLSLLSKLLMRLRLRKRGKT